MRPNPSPGHDTQAEAGVPRTLGEKVALPEGAHIEWDFGDGSPLLKGRDGQVAHAFPHAGSFSVTEAVVDEDGRRRTAGLQVSVRPRPVARAVPDSARAALILERPWHRLAAAEGALTQAGLVALIDEPARRMSAALGFDLRDPAQAAEHGFDPEEGFAFFTVPEDPEALLLAAGSSDPARMEAAVRRALSRPGQSQTLREKPLASGQTLVLAQGEEHGEQLGFLFRFGYLYLRLPGATDPSLALTPLAGLGPDQNLAQDAGFQAASAQVGPGDAVFYSRPAHPGEGEAGRPRMLRGFDASAISISAQAQRIRIKLHAHPRAVTFSELTSALSSRGPAPELATRLPRGAAAIARISGAPSALFTELEKAEGESAAHLADRARELFGEDLGRALEANFTGNAVVAVYLDATALLEVAQAQAEEAAPLDRSTFLAALQLSPGKQAEVERLFRHAAQSQAGSAELRAPGGPAFRLAQGAVWAAARDGVLFLALTPSPASPPPEIPPPPPPRSRRHRRTRGHQRAEAPPALPEATSAQLGPLSAVLIPQPGAKDLAAELRIAGLPDLSPREQLAWLDVAGVFRALEDAAKEQGAARLTVRALADRFAGVRDAVLILRPGSDGLDAQLDLRLVPIKGAPPEGRSAGREP